MQSDWRTALGFREALAGHPSPPKGACSPERLTIAARRRPLPSAGSALTLGLPGPCPWTLPYPSLWPFAEATAGHK